MFYDYMIYIVFDFMMAVIMFLFGMWFYKSEGKAANFLSGYNMKSADERKKYDENAMCKAYGKRIKSVYLIATRDLSNLWLQFFLSQNQGFMRLFEKTVLK